MTAALDLRSLLATSTAADLAPDLAPVAAPALVPDAGGLGHAPEARPAEEPAPARPVLRVVPAPPCAPPYDDDPQALPLPVLLPRLLAAVPAQPLPRSWDDSDWFTEDRTPAADLPPVRPVAHSLVQGLVEVLSGARPLRLFRLHLEVELYAHLAARLDGGRRLRGPRPQRVVRSLHVQVRPEGVAEVCATVLEGDGCIAVALRLEGFGGRWICTDLEGL